MDLQTAIQAHGEWKVKLRSAIIKKEKLDAQSIGRDDACALGKWLHGEGKAKFGGLPTYTGCVHKHATFHQEAGKVAVAINAGRYEDADRMLAGGSSYAAASSAVGGAILALGKDAGL